MKEGDRTAWLEARPRFVSDVLARRVALRGTPLIVLQDPVTGRHWRSSPRLYRLVQLLDGRRTVEEALTIIRVDPHRAEADVLLNGLIGMAASGLVKVPGLRGSRDRTGPATMRNVLQRVIYARIPVGNLAPLLPFAMPLFGWVYSRAGTLFVLALVAVAGWSLSYESDAIAGQFERLSQIGAKNIVIGWGIFVAAKMLHELGHALAARRAGAAEGLAFTSFRWGISFMFLLPAPYVDASSAWLIANRWRRAQVGLAGIQMDLLVASIAALAWVEIGEGFFSDRLFELVLLCSISSLLFNLNPLIRLDGYYVLSDIIEIPNLQSRGWAALRGLGLWLLGLGQRPEASGELGLALYSAASWTWRWSVFIGIFWLAGTVTSSLAFTFAGIIAVLYLAIPLANGIARWMSILRSAPRRAIVAPAIVTALAIILLAVPLPVHVVAEGIVWRDGVTWIFAPADGILRNVAPAGTTERFVIRLDNPELRRTLTQLQYEAEGIAIEARRARDQTPHKADALDERERAVRSQIAAIEDEMRSWAVALPTKAVWHPLRAEILNDAWIRRDDQRPLGVAVADGPVFLRVVLDQWQGPAALAALMKTNHAIPVRLRGETAATMEAELAQLPDQARDELPSPALSLASGGSIPVRTDARGEVRPIERVFELRLALRNPPPGAPLRHGARIEANIRLPEASLAALGWRRLRQALQRHLNV